MLHSSRPAACSSERRAGLVEQIGSPTELYDRPANTFVAGFIGSPKMNFIKGSVQGVADGAVTIANPAFHGGALTVPIASARRLETGMPVTVGLRPENLELGGARPLLDLKAEVSENLGGSTQVYAATPEGNIVTILAPGRPAMARGDALPVGLVEQVDAAGTEAGAAL
jgi:ABC-type sugar transport system ATPase subunit